MLITGQELLESGNPKQLIFEAKLKVLRSMCIGHVISCCAWAYPDYTRDCLVVEGYYDSSAWTGRNAA